MLDLITENIQLYLCKCLIINLHVPNKKFVSLQFSNKQLHGHILII